MHTVTSNSRIAKNTLMLYFRMFVVMIVSLYTSRVVLAVLGVVDYGIYNVVGGLVAMFTILTGSLSVSTSRFITFELGKGNAERLNETFSTVRAIHIALGLIIFVLSEIIALWFLNYQLNIPDERMESAKYALHCSIFSFSITILFVPYNAALIAHEKMDTFAYLSILDVVLKLLIVYLLYISPIDKLVFYSILLAVSTVIYQGFFYIYCRQKFTECKSFPAFNKSIVRCLSSFIGWTFLGNGAVVAKDQGTVVLLNIFFGPAVNAAQGVAMQVNSVVTRLLSGFMTAVQPQITKSYAAVDINHLNYLLIKSTKFSFFLTAISIFPLILNCQLLLNFWLVEVPNYATSFTILILIYTFIDCFTSPLVTAVLATSKVRDYEVLLTVLYILNLFFSFIALKMGAQPEIVFILAIFFKFFVYILLLYQCTKLFLFALKNYLSMICKRIVPTLLFCSAITLVLADFFRRDSLLDLIANVIIFELFSLSFIWFLGFEKSERQFVCNHLNIRFKK